MGKVLILSTVLGGVSVWMSATYFSMVAFEIYLNISGREKQMWQNGKNKRKTPANLHEERVGIHSTNL